MRCGPWLCLSFTLYKYLLKLLRLGALFYNLVHYFPREEEPLSIGDRGNLPLTWDDSCIFLDKEEADKNAVKLVRIQGKDKPPKLCGGPRSGLSEQTIDILQESQSVTIGDGDVVYAPPHLYRDKVKGMWIERKWQFSKKNIQGSWPSVSGRWVVEGSHGDKPGGSGLKSDLARFAVALEWAAEVFGSAGDRGEFVEVDRNAVRKALSTRRRTCQGAAEKLNEKRRDGVKLAYDDAGMRVTSMLDYCENVVERSLCLELTSQDGALGVQRKLQDEARVCWSISQSLSKTWIDPDHDFTATLMVAFSISFGILCGLEWKNITGHKSSLSEAFGVGEDWVWFIAFVSLVVVCGGGCLIIPLCISRSSRARQVIENQGRLGKKSS